jgi:hypothetical protein
LGTVHLAPTHPGGAAGLGFVGEAQRFFAVILIAYSVVVAGLLANSVVYGNIPLVHFASAIAAYVTAAVLFILISLLVFASILFTTKISGMARYGSLATEYTQSFQQKWIVDRRNQQEVVFGTADIQSLADLGNSFAFVEKMKLLPMGSRTPIHLGHRMSDSDGAAPSHRHAPERHHRVPLQSRVLRSRWRQY